MWYYNTEIIKTPKAMQIGDFKYSKALFKDTAKLAELGIKPYSETTPNNRYYWNGAYTIDTSGAEVIGTYAGTARDVATLTTGMLEQTKSCVSSKLASIDWYWVRASKSGGEAVPSAIATYSDTLYTEYAAKKTEIAALDTLAKVIEYEARAYTQVDKVKVLYTSSDSETQGESPTKAVGDFKEYHASDTVSTARSINMVTHYTDNPNDDVDAGFVSLTAD